MKVLCKKNLSTGGFKKGKFYNVAKEHSDNKSYFILSDRKYYYGTRFDLGDEPKIANKSLFIYPYYNFSEYFMTAREIREKKLIKIFKNGNKIKRRISHE